MSVEAKERLKRNFVQNNDNNDENLNIEGPNRIRKCPECGSKDLILDRKRAELYCAECGMVIAENIIDLGPEWRAFDSEQFSKRVRVGAPMTNRIHDKGLSNLLPKDFQGRDDFRRMRRRVRDSGLMTSERSLIFALSEIDRMACALGLSRDIREAASVLYRKAMKKRLIRGRSYHTK